MILDHVTYQVPVGTLGDSDVGEFFCDLLGMQEVDPDEEIEGKWNVRWFEDKDSFQVHLVEPGLDAPVQEDPVDLKLGHFCAVIDRGAYSRALHSRFRLDIGRLEGRAWLRGPGGVRVEVRPKPLKVDSGAQEFGRTFSMPISDISELQKMTGETDQKLEFIFVRCLRIFRERNMQHKDSWRREGWRGTIFNLRRKVERAWDYLWGLEPGDFQAGGSPFNDIDVDDLLDAINYAALAVLAVEEGNRDGKGGWW